jgi:hypothetical protein
MGGEAIAVVRSSPGPGRGKAVYPISCLELQQSIRDNLTPYAPVAQLDRVPGYEPGGREFESLRARQLSIKINRLRRSSWPVFSWLSNRAKNIHLIGQVLSLHAFPGYVTSIIKLLTGFQKAGANEIRKQGCGILHVWVDIQRRQPWGCFLLPIAGPGHG